LALKSPRGINSRRDCSIRFVRSIGEAGFAGGRVTQRLGRFTRTAVSCCGEQMLTGLQWMQFFARIADPPLALFPSGWW